MENIHVIATDKPSRLFKANQKLVFDNTNDPTKCISAQHIYITSDEEINQQTEPCWCINTIKNTWNNDLIYYQGAMPQYHFVGFKKIILTTDQDLIKDGVQAIDDEFLEWYVKNPSCEEVEVELKTKQLVKPYDVYNEIVSYYKITIPKEELNQVCENCKIEISKWGCACGKQEEPISFPFFDKEKADAITKEGQKVIRELQSIIQEETIKEVAERILANNIDGLRDALQDDDLFYFYKGVIQSYGEAMAKYQAEKMYSEINVKKSFENESLKWWMSLTMGEQVEIGLKYNEPTFNLTLRAIIHEFSQFKKK